MGLSRSRTPITHRWKQIVGVILVVAVAVCLGGFYAFLRTPGWFDPPSIAAADRQTVRNNLIEAEQAFTESLRQGGGPFTYHLYQDDLNRWLAMRNEIYPMLAQSIPSQISDIVVLFDDGAITLAGRVARGTLEVILSIDVTVQMEDDAIVLRAAALRCGSVRVPMDFIPIGLDEEAAWEPEELWPGSPRMWGNLLGGFHVESRAWWKNGGIEYRVLGVRVGPGKLSLEIEPLGPHWPRK